MGDSKTKKDKRINEKTLIVTVDIGKGKNTGYCRCPDGTEVKPFEFSNDGRGFNAFWDIVLKTREKNNLQEVIVGFESTGAYAEPLMQYLKKRAVVLAQVNPMHTKRLKELQGNSPNKTDKKDPRVIADIIELGHALSVVIPEEAAAELRRLTGARERSIARRTALINQLQELVFIIFPEFWQVIKDVKGKTAQYLLKECPRPEDILQYGLEALRSCMRRVSRGRFTAAHAEALYKAAGCSVGIKSGQVSIVLEIKELVSLIEAACRFIGELEEKMSKALKEIPYSRSILSIKGIGEVTAAGLIGEVGDFRKFKTISEILKLSGLDLYEISSGKHKGTRRISKRGRALLRKLLFFAAINVVRKGGIMYEKYQEYLNGGMLKMKALIAIARKLLCIMFALVRDDSEYVVGYSKHMKAAA